MDQSLGLVATNLHVIAWADGPHDLVARSVRDGIDRSSVCEVAYCDPAYDLAILKTPIAADASALPISSSLPRKGAEVLVIGSPAGHGTEVFQNSVTRGIVSNISTLENGLQYYQLDAAVNPGNSGGPVVNDAGVVLGVVTLKLMDHEGIAFAVPGSVLARAIESAATGDRAEQAKLILLGRKLTMAVGQLQLSQLFMEVCFSRVQSSWAEALTSGKDVQTAVAHVTAELATPLDLNNANMESVKHCARRWQQSGVLPPSLTFRIASILSALDEMCSFLVRPTGSYMEFERTWRGKLTKLRTECDALERDTRAFLEDRGVGMALP